MPGVIAALNRLRVPVCVASSSFPQKLRMGLEVVGLYDRFTPNIISGTLVARGKPEPDVFIFAAGWMHVSPRNCLVIEDSVAGVTSAHRAGMRVFDVRWGQPLYRRTSRAPTEGRGGTGVHQDGRLALISLGRGGASDGCIDGGLVTWAVPSF